MTTNGTAYMRQEYDSCTAATFWTLNELCSAAIQNFPGEGKLSWMYSAYSESKISHFWQYLPQYDDFVT